MTVDTQVGYPAAPTAEPLDGTLLSIVTPTSGVEGLGDGAGLFDTFNCIDTGVNPGVICGPVSTSKFADAESPIWVNGLAFAAYGVTVCKLVEPGYLADGVTAAFTAAESRVVEQALMEDVFTASPGRWAAALDITPPVGAVDPVTGVGLLESHMARNYAGKGILHVPRVVATIAASKGAMELDGRVLKTSLNTPVAAGGGYDLPNSGPTGAEAAAGEKWIYATGQVLLLRKTLETREQLHRGPAGRGLDPNDMIALAEASYIVAVDCYKAAVRVKIHEPGTP